MEGGIGSAINGQFATVNGNSFIDSDGDYFFILTSLVNHQDYLFQIDYAYNGGNAVAIMSMIPEPTTVALIAGLALIGVIAWRRRVAL